MCMPQKCHEFTPGRINIKLLQSVTGMCTEHSIQEWLLMMTIADNAYINVL